MSAQSRWYVVHTYSGYENKVAGNIEKMVENRNMQDQILEIKIPTETVIEIKDDKKREVERKLFPGYVIVKVAVTLDRDDRPQMTDDAWLVIRNTRGVTGFVGPEGRPVALSEEEVRRMGVEKKSIEVSYNVGDLVNITDPILEGFQGTVEEINLDRNQVTVKIMMFGKETTAEIELDKVEPAVK
ncbi:MAG: transcription termination/antitermination factor NusG [Clostridiales bacterium]|nr:transcription termination/antitermination factor NusG [Clostridiales bacterium]